MLGDIGVTHLEAHDVGVRGHHGAAVVREGRFPEQHLVGADPERPPVTLLPEFTCATTN